MNGRTFLTVTDLPEFFRGVSFNTSSKRAILPNGAALNRSQFRVWFGGYTFALDAHNERTTRDAWRAFTSNHAFRPPTV